MKRVHIVVLALTMVLSAAIPVAAQPVISARSGVIAYGEGAVYVSDKAWEPAQTKFDAIKENTLVRTGEGRVEVLLVPGTFLRLGENGSFRLLTNRLIDTRLDLLRGSAVVEVDQVTKDNNVTIVNHDATIQFHKAGLYRLDSEPASVKVFKGAATVQMGERNIEVPSGKMLGLAGETAAVEKFDTEDTDTLDRWSHRRGDLVASANISAANYVRNYGANGSYSGFSANSWAWNPYFGMYTYLPYSGQFFTPYGGWYWSPVTVINADSYPPPIMARGGSRNPTATHRNPVAEAPARMNSGTYSGGMAAMPPRGSYSSGAVSGGSSMSGARAMGSAGGHSSAGAGHR
jgi:hypothetical protein